MRAQEFTEGFNEIDDRIHDILAKKGYKKLGQGIDQAAYLEPGGRTVLKVFGADINASTKFSRSHRMFFTWAKYCMANPDNPFLVKFDDYESFIFNGRRYLQIRQELLKPIPAKLYHRVSAVADLAYDYVVFKNQKTLEKYMRENRYFSEIKAERVMELVNSLGADKVTLLSKTLIAVRKIANKKGYDMDLHEGNYMVRSDQTPVIVDPWVD